MPLHFAAARGASPAPVARALTAPRPYDAANDNGRRLADDALLDDALRHFATHGLGALSVARANLAAAESAGDATGRVRWQAICQAFDRRTTRLR
ncbi:hypothetical protein GRI40_03000 [Altererythrobacter aerius]|uniref:Uncharacterized protein n=1 Tax=Tsuneonella aeria TaxID=1837929 RepID=A0A6I4TDF6_9SPHN|nr:hypothetical protein [Tsuneonella aeria]MXO74190.1 hypothetical protein [Tsuneonella aeria]